MSTLGYYICWPFAWIVRMFYELTASYGLAIILFTLIIKLIMLPFQLKSKKSMMRMSRMSGKMQEIQKKYANNQAKMQEELQKFYTEEGVNPMSGCLWTFLPLPILIALYSIIRQPITHFMMLSKDVMYDLVNKAYAAGIDMSSIVNLADDGTMALKNDLPQLTAYGQINLVKAIEEKAPDLVSGIDGWVHMKYGFIGLDLAVNPWDAVKGFQFSWAIIGLILIPLLAGFSQFLFSKITMKTQPQNVAGNASGKMMMWMMPLFSVYIAFMMPAALGVYWIVQSVFSLVQELVLNKIFGKKIQEEEDAKEAARQAERQKRMAEGRKVQEQHKQEQKNVQKQTLKEKQKAAQEAKEAKAKKAAVRTTEAGRVGERPYARGRAYKENRYDEQ